MAIAKQKYRVLYFHRGPAPSAEQVDDAHQYGPGVMFRNALMHTVGEGMEPCDGVAGDVPRDYARKYPDAMPYVKWREVVRNAPQADDLQEGERRPNRVLGPAGPATVDRRPTEAGTTALPGLVGGRPEIELPPPPADALSGPATSGLQPTGRGSKRQRAAAESGDPRWTGVEPPPPPPPA